MESVCEDPDVIAQNIVVSWQFLSNILIQTQHEKDLKQSQAAVFPFFLLTSSPRVSCLQQVKLGNPDYIHCNTEEAIEDFMKRIKCYESSYQPLDEVLDR